MDPSHLRQVARCGLRVTQLGFGGGTLGDPDEIISDEQVHQNLAGIRHPIPAGFWQALRREGLLHPDSPLPGGSVDMASAAVRGGTPLIGASPVRKEDHRFLTGRGCFGDDLNVDGQCHAVVVRSPHPHALLNRIDTTAATSMPGVVLVLTGAELSGHIGPIPSFARTAPFAIPNHDGSPMPEPDQPVLAHGRVRYLGEPVAFVVAEDADSARAASDAVVVDYSPLPAMIDIATTTAEGAPLIWEEFGSNVSFEWEGGDASGSDAAFAAAHHVTRLELHSNRIAPVFMEPRTAMGQYDAREDRLTLHTGSQGVHGVQRTLCGMLGLDAKRLRVVTPDTGGGFGARGPVYPEMALTLIAARRLGRAVKWVADRSESFLCDTQCRDHVLIGELALERDGRFTALRVQVDCHHGAYVPGRMFWVVMRFLVPTLGGVYAIPTGHTRVRGIFSNTTPQAAIRGVGRVEATYLMESLVDAAAREIGVDAIALRRRNLLTDDMLPFTSVGGARYEACSFAPHLERALAMADWDGFPHREQADRAANRLRGIGCAMYVENDGGAPSEFAAVQVLPEDRVELCMGTQNFGMGHETTFAQILGQHLGLPLECITHVDGDTDRVARGSGSHGSRSTRVGGTAVVMCAQRLLARAREVVAGMLQVAAREVRFDHGEFVCDASGQRVHLFQAARFARDQGEPLVAEAEFEQRRESYSSGCHVCEVAVDPDTGRVQLLQHVLVTDVGCAINPMLVDGQMHGGAACGVGQAAMEQVIHDPESGQTLSGSLMDYCIPRADDLPMFTTHAAETPETDNPLQARGVGEGPTTGTPAAYMNALRDALARAGAAPVQMPATAERVWRALRDRR